MKFFTLAITSLVAFLVFVSCGKSKSDSGSSQSSSAVGSSSQRFLQTSTTSEVGTSESGSSYHYSSSSGGNVEYYNPGIGTSSSYSLDVEYDGSGDVEQINFSNGGWLDGSHIVDQEHNGDGTITVTTDRGYEYTVDESEDYQEQQESEEDEEESEY